MKSLAWLMIMNAEHIENGIEFPPFNVPVDIYRAEQAVAVVLLIPAMGTAAGFYQPFAAELAGVGCTVLVPEIPGTCESHPRPSRKVDYGYRELAEGYLPVAVALAREIAPDLPVVLIGHSLGAQLGALAVSRGTIDIDALVTVAGGHIYYRNWSGAAAAKVRFAGLLFHALATLLGYLPGQRVGFGGPQARSLIRDWSTIIRTGHFLPAIEEIKRETPVPALCIGIDGDTFSPEKSVRSLAEVVHAEVEILAHSCGGNPHSSWARKPTATIALLKRWLQGRIEGF
jgi:predicted alpha/beta hydrolase